MKLNLCRCSKLVLLLVCLVSAPAHAAVVTLTFDEAGIDLFLTENGEQVLDQNNQPIPTVITTQYAALGATFSGTAQAIVKLGANFNNPFLSDGQLAHMQTGGNKLALIDLSNATDILSFDYRRPADIGDIFLRLFKGASLVHDFGQIGWDPAVTPDWITFSYAGEFGLYDRVELSGDSKFVLDNFAYGSPVPLPAPLLLLLGGLLGLGGFRHGRI